MTFDLAVYRAAELRLHEAALECAQAVYDKKGIAAIDLLDAAMAYAKAVGYKPPYGRTAAQLGEPTDKSLAERRAGRAFDGSPCAICGGDS